GDELERATFVGRVLRTMDPDLSRVVIARDFEAPAILESIVDQTANQGVAAIAREYRRTLTSDPASLLPALPPIRAGPCRPSEGGAFALVLYEFGSVEDSEIRRELAPRLMAVGRALIGAFAAASTASRLIFTRAVPFSVPDRENHDLADSLLFTRSLGA